MIKIKKGLNLPITGFPVHTTTDSKRIRSVAILGEDYVGMKPTMMVEVGDQVKIGQPLFEDKKNPGIFFTSPGSGTLSAINRGARRTLQSVVIDLKDEEESVDLSHYKINQAIDKNKIRNGLLESGLWTSFRTRPFSKIPGKETKPDNIFINCMDTNPLALNPVLILDKNLENLLLGVEILNALEPKNIYICIPENFSFDTNKLDNNVQVHTFSGPHPSGLVGTHMHFLSPPSLTNINWHVSSSDLVRIGSFFKNGKLSLETTISLAGPKVENPRVIKTRLGASTDEICAGELTGIDNRVISGSILNGREAYGPNAYLGKYHNQVSVIEEPSREDRLFMNWLRPGFNLFSHLPIYISKLSKDKKYSFKALMNGSDRAIVPIGVYEEVFPQELLVSLLLRAIVIKDTEQIQLLGGLELDEEDLSLCSYVCPSKYDFSSLLRTNLDQIEVEG
tara:strand:+ start:250 stop:1599 length:1350 start_codon:yes stop_codon:yes gene_type:complete